MHLEQTPEKILEEINIKVTSQQNQFNRIWTNILAELKKQKIFFSKRKAIKPGTAKIYTRLF